MVEMNTNKRVICPVWLMLIQPIIKLESRAVAVIILLMLLMVIMPRPQPPQPPQPNFRLLISVDNFFARVSFSFLMFVVPRKNLLIFGVFYFVHYNGIRLIKIYSCIHMRSY